jgi:hypothetical protein
MSQLQTQDPNEEERSGDQETTLSTGEIHDVLRNDRRRRAIRCLLDSEEALSVRELSERVATLETGEEPAPRDKRRSVYISLHQTHLPKLDDLAIVEYDLETKDVTLAEQSDVITSYMGDDETPTPQWPKVQLGVGALGALLVLGAVAGLSPLTVVGAGVTGLVFITLQTAVAGYALAVGQPVFEREC